MGDLRGQDVRLPNTAYNSLRRSVRRSEGVVKGVYVKGKLSQEAQATREGVLDPRTRRILWKLINKQALEAVHGVVKTGKESRVYLAKGREARFLRARAGRPGGREVDDGGSESLDSQPDLASLLSRWDDVSVEEAEDDDDARLDFEELEEPEDKGVRVTGRRVPAQGADAEQGSCEGGEGRGDMDRAGGGERGVEGAGEAAGAVLGAGDAQVEGQLEDSTDIAVKVFFTTLDQFRCVLGRAKRDGGRACEGGRARRVGKERVG